MATKNIEKDQSAELLASGRVRLLLGDGRKGHADLGPYDAIHVGAAAPVLPQALIDQLKVFFGLIHRCDLIILNNNGWIIII